MLAGRGICGAIGGRLMVCETTGWRGASPPGRGWRGPLRIWPGRGVAGAAGLAGAGEAALPGTGIEGIGALGVGG